MRHQCITQADRLTDRQTGRQTIRKAGRQTGTNHTTTAVLRCTRSCTWYMSTKLSAMHLALLHILYQDLVLCAACSIALTCTRTHTLRIDLHTLRYQLLDHTVHSALYRTVHSVLYRTYVFACDGGILFVWVQKRKKRIREETRKEEKRNR